MTPSNTALKKKHELSDEIAQQTAEFLARGAQVVEVPFGVGREGDAESYRDLQSKIATMKRAAEATLET